MPGAALPQGRAAKPGPRALAPGGVPIVVAPSLLQLLLPRKHSFYDSEKSDTTCHSDTAFAGAMRGQQAGSGTEMWSKDILRIARRVQQNTHRW